MGQASLEILAALGTYLIHSSVFLLAVLALSRLTRPRPRLRVHLWQAALVGGLLSAGLQSGYRSEPWLGRHALALDPPRAEAPARGAPPTQHETTRSAATAPVAERVAPPALPLPRREARPRPERRAPASAAAPARAPDTAPFPWAALGWLLVGALSVLGAASVALESLALGRRLRRRQPLDDARLGLDLTALARRIGLHRAPDVYEVATLDTPITVGWLRPSIFLPPRALTELSLAQRTALLAHELAHVAHRDPARFSLAVLLERVLFFQPLLRLGRRRLVAAAEEAADEAAVQHGEGALSLAGCLASVAAWKVGRGLPATACGASSAGRSRLGARIERLLELDGRPAPTEQAPLRWAPALVAALTLGALALPGLAAAPGAPRPTPIPLAPPPSPPTGATLPAPLARERDLLRAEIRALSAEFEGLCAALAQLGLDPSAAPSLARLETALGSLQERDRELDRRLAALNFP